MADEDEGKYEPYRTDLAAILAEKNLERPQKEIQNENLELKN